MIPATALRAAIKRWRNDEEGSVAVETLMMVPLMVWAFLSTLVYFDAYRTEAVSEKAALTIADMFSRETDYIDNDYMDGASDLLKFLTLHDSDPKLRVTVFRWHAHSAGATGHYHRVWSRSRGSGLSNLTTTGVRNLSAKLPVMYDGEYAILVETWTDYETRFNNMFVVALQDFEMQTFTVISPRFDRRLCWTPDADSPDATANEIC